MVQAVNKLTMTDSQLNMWRAVIAIAHADGTVQQEEKDYLYKTLANIDRSYNLTDAQRMALATSAAATALWDKGWFLFPNPVYGPWEKLGWGDVFPSDKNWEPK